MAYFKKNIRRAILSLHILFSSLWAGAAISMIVLMFAKNPQNASELLAYNWAIKLIDDWIVIGSASASFSTGILLSWKTPWGFFKHWWVTVKLILTIAMIILGTFWLGKWTNESVYLVQEYGLNVFSNQKYVSFQSLSMLWGSLQFITLIFVFFISVFKPWKKVKRK